MPGALQRLLLLACSLAWAAGDELLVGPEAQPEPQPVEPAYWGDRIINVCTAENVPGEWAACRRRPPTAASNHWWLAPRLVASVWHRHHQADWQALTAGFQQHRTCAS